MQLDGLMNILAPNTAAKGSATTSNPADGLLDALQGGFESILSDMQNVVMQTAEGLGEALSAVPEALMEKIQDLLGGMGDLAEGTPLATFLQNNQIEPELLGVSKQEAQSLVFDGENFTAKGKTFDLSTALENLQSKVESLVEMTKGTVAEKESAMRQLSDEFKALRPKNENNNVRRNSNIAASDDFLKTRESSQVVRAQANAHASYAGAAENKSLFSKYAKQESEVKEMAKPVSVAAASALASEQLILPEAVSGVMAKRGEDVAVKASPDQVLNLSNGNSTAKPSEVINRIVNYLDQQQLTSKGELDVLVKHDELGYFRVNVARNAEAGAVDLRITSGQEGHRFFAENEVELIRTLNQKGVKLNDVKLVQADFVADVGASSKSNSNSSGFEQNDQRGQFAQQSGQRHQHSQDGSERRRQLWEEYRERMGASA